MTKKTTITGRDDDERKRDGVSQGSEPPEEGIVRVTTAPPASALGPPPRIKLGPDPDRFIPTNNAIDRVRAALHDPDIVAEGDAGFERTKVRYLMTVLGLAGEIPRLRRLYADVHGKPGLSFAIFNEQYPTFPVLLRADRLNGVELYTDNRAVLPAWFQTKKTRKVPFFPAFEAFRWGRHSCGRVPGLVFPRKGFPRGMVIHGPGLERYNCGGCLTHYTDEGEPLFTIRSLESLIGRIATRDY
jgi:hypothetical protein